MKPLGLASLCIACLALGGCSLFNPYLERKDTILFSSGDAVASNMAIQTIDPWPRNVRDNDIPMDGTRAALAIQKYQRFSARPTGGGGPSDAAASGAAVGAGAAAPSGAAPPGGGY